MVHYMIPYAVLPILAAMQGIDGRVLQVSRNLGASTAQTLWRVILLSIRPGMISGAVFAFIASWDEIVVTPFLSKFTAYTLPRRMWNGIRENTVHGFVADELQPHEDMVDRLGHVPEEIGRAIKYTSSTTLWPFAPGGGCPDGLGAAIVTQSAMLFSDITT